MKNLVVTACLCFCFGVAAGCGGSDGGSGPQAAPTSPEVSSDAELKERLEFIAEAGGMGSAMAGVVELCEKKGDKSLIADAKKLMNVSKPEAAKKIAADMLKKL